MEAVKENIKSTVDRSLQLSLLTLAPASWTHETNKWSFFYSEYSAAQAIFFRYIKVDNVLFVIM
jgi:hypothetical protein